MQIHEECKIRKDELERTLSQVSSSWHRLEERLAETEEAFIVKRDASWKKWFRLDEAELSNWAEGGLRQQVRERVRDLVLGPVAERMAAKVGYVPAEEDAEDPASANEQPSALGTDSAGPSSPSGASAAGRSSAPFEEPRSSSPVLNAIQMHYDRFVRHVVESAQKADAELEKKIKKTEKDERKKGVVALGMQDTKKVAALKRQRPGIWEAAKSALERLINPGKLLKEFAREELAEDKASAILTAVPVVVTRAICDFFFHRSLLGYDQVEKWWSETKATLKGDEQLWQRLLEQEGMLLRRIDSGMEDVGNGRRNYAMYANFGGSDFEVLNLLNDPPQGDDALDIPPKLLDPILLCVHEVSQMHQRLRKLRDGALWRVVETAQGIHKELQADDAVAETPWQAVSAAEGVAALLEAIRHERSEDDIAGSDPMEGALAVMRRLELLAACAAELTEFAQATSPACSAGAIAALTVVLDGASALNEELLAMLDDPTEEAEKAWLKMFAELLGTGDAGAKMEEGMAALPLKPDSSLEAKPRSARSRLLKLARGIQVFLSDGALRAQVVAPLGEPPALEADASPTSGGLSTASTAASAPSSPSRRTPAEAAAFLREQRKKLDLEALAAPTSPRMTNSPSGAAFRPPDRGARSSVLRIKAIPNSPQQGRGVFPGGGGGARGRGSGSGESGVAPFLQAAWRPDTPSTACEDADAQRGAPAKLVDGVFIPPRPSSRGLPPLPGLLA